MIPNLCITIKRALCLSKENYYFSLAIKFLTDPPAFNKRKYVILTNSKNANVFLKSLTSLEFHE